MTTFKKNYVGKGKMVENLSFPVLRITIKTDELLKYVREFQGTNMVTIEITETKSPDQNGRTHTAYVNELVEQEEETPVAQEKQPEKAPKKRKTKKTEPELEEAPF